MKVRKLPPEHTLHVFSGEQQQGVKINISTMRPKDIFTMPKPKNLLNMNCDLMCSKLPKQR